MARIFKPKSSSKQRNTQRRPGQPTSMQNIVIDSLDHHGRGVCRQHNPVLFVEGALPGETVDVRVERKEKRVWWARAEQVSSASDYRISPFCEYYGECGGCQTQHADTAFILEQKQQAVGHLLERIGGFSTLAWQAPLCDKSRGYRRKTRLSVDARRKDDLRIGFRQAGSKHIVDIKTCGVLSVALQALMTPLRNVVGAMSLPSAIGHINLFEADNVRQICIRLVKDLPRSDIHALKAFAGQAECQLMFETSGDVIDVIAGPDVRAQFAAEPGVSLSVEPNDFVQVNNAINQNMVAQAMAWLSPAGNETIVDLFCGVGNFSLPLAKRCARVIGVEGVAKMVHRAEQNAHKNGIENAQFVTADLASAGGANRWLTPDVEKVLLDPARDGARETITSIAQSHVSQVLYVSCNPATFARDAAIMREKQWQIDKIALMDMFPNTAHTELMALFVRNKHA